MDLEQSKKVIIVEGTSDKRKVLQIIKEPVDVICTNGTISLTKLDELVDSLYERDIYILVDADGPGEKLRKQLQREMPNAHHLYIDRMYREVATAPLQHLATVLLSANLTIHVHYLV